MEFDKEEVLNELMNFEKNYGREDDLPECLERFLVHIAKSGDTIYPWNKIKPVILKKIELVVDEFNTRYPYENNPVLPNVKPFNFKEMKAEIIEKMDYFYGAPFTIQRICELLTDPSEYYKRSDKFMRGLEKNVRVISTVEARRADIENDPYSFHKEFNRSPKNSSSPLPSSSNILLSSPLPSSSSSSSFMNGLNEKAEITPPILSISSRLAQSCSSIQDQGPLPSSPAPLQQLDSFTTVFASPPSTPLAVVSDMHPYDAGSPSSSSSSSSDSSPQPSSSSSPPPSLSHDENELNQSIDADLEESKPKDEDLNDSKSEDSNEPTKIAGEPVSNLEQVEPMDQTDGDKLEAQEKLEAEDLIKLETSNSEPESIKEDSGNDVPIKEEKEASVEQSLVTESNVKEELTSRVKEAVESTASLSESSPEKKQECVLKSPSPTDKSSAEKLLSSETMEKINVGPVDNSISPVVASTTESSQSSGQKEESETNEAENSKCGGDSPDVSNDSIKTESTESVNNSFEENFIQEKDKDQESDQEPGQEITSSGSSTISAEETPDTSVNSSFQSINEEKPESH